MKRFILFNGTIVKDRIQTHTGSSFFNYGNGFFETVLYQDKRLYFWNSHLDRLEHTGEVFEFAIRKDLLSENLVYKLIKKNRCVQDTMRVKILCAPVQDENVWDSMVFVKEYKRTNKDYSLFIHREPKDGFFCNFKSVNYQALLYWRNYYREHFNADEVLFTGFHHNILEASSSNILLVKDHTLFYVAIHDNYLAGIMQKNIVKDYKECGFRDVVPVNNGFTQERLKDADEILLSNSLIIAQRAAVIHTGKKNPAFTYRNHGWAQRIRDYFLSW